MNFNNINLYAEPTTKFSTVQRFEKIVAQYPEKIALRFDNQVLTYHELNFAANQYANYLIEKGVKSSSRVAIYLDDSLEMISTLLGVLKTGASYIPLPESFPIDRVVNIITDASCNMLITQEKLFDNKSFTIVPTLITDKTDISSFSPFNLNRYHQPHDCVYSVFTSGSTGRPKGVMISDANLGALVDALIETFDCTENDNSTKYFGYGFDASVAEIFPTLLTGATLHIINKAIKLEPSKLNDYFETYKITLSGLPTQFGEIFISEIDNRSLRILWVGGDKLRRVTKRTYKLVNLYGPSETTVACTSFVVDKIDYPNIPIGKPLKNYTTHIVDEQMQPVVVGEIGELCIGGAGVGLGYMNLPEQTEAKFIRDPFVAQCESQAKSNTLYKTGDLARYQQDGNIEFMGRNDFQVKIRGFRIELGEIEQALLKQVEIKDCCVLARMSASGDNRLCAYYVTTPDYKLTQLEISQKLSASLPVYMLPQDYIEMAVLPINSNGKVDRKVLPVPDYSAHQRVYIAARNAEETQVCQAFAEILEQAQISVEDDFFDLGGNSIRAIRLVANLQQYFKIGVSDVFALKTPAELAKLPQSIGYEGISHQAERDFYPLSLAQERMFVAHQVNQDSTSYNTPLNIKIVNEINREQLGEALSDLIKRHVILSARFKAVNNKIVQYFSDEINIIKEFQTASEIEIDNLFDDFIKPFNLQNDTLFRTKLVKVNSRLHYLFIDTHHIIFDGGSVYPLLNDLYKLYAGETLRKPPINYTDYAIWQREGRGQKLAISEQNYWQSRFSSSDLEPINLPLDYQRLATSGSRGDSYTRMLSNKLLQSLKQRANKLDVSLNSLFLAAYVVLWYRYTNQKQIIIGNALSGRNRSELHSLIGMFVNTVPVLTSIDKEYTLGRLIQDKQKDLVQILDNQNYQMEDLIEYLNLKPVNGQNPLFDVVFNYLDLHTQVGHFSLESSGFSRNEAKFDLLLNIEDHGSRLDITFNYKTTLFKSTTIARMHEAYLNICQAIADNLDSKVKEIKILSSKEYDLVIQGFNQTKHVYDTSRTYFDDYLDHVAQTPTKTALICGDQKISYAELHSVASHYANRLKAFGIQSGDCVGILLEPSIERIALVLASHLCGASYMGLLSEMPLDRLQFMAHDAQVKVIATTPAEYEQHAGLINSTLESVPACTLFKIIDYALHVVTPHIESRPHPYDTACIIYTSGTTGKPKGVPLNHFSINNYLIWHANFFRVTAQDNCSHSSSFSFDASILDIFLPLKLGATMCVVPDALRKDLSALSVYLGKHHCTVAFFTTKLGELFMDTMPPSMRCLIVGGEELKKTFLNDTTVLGNICGPTECTIAAAAACIEPGTSDITIGKPVYNTKSYILDENLQPVPIGVAGEWHVAGYGVSSGYINRPDQTAEKFISNSFIQVDDPEYQHYSRLYKTGDMVCWTEEGNIKYLGRKDFQVKIRGYRIEIGEIEFHLQSHERINGVIVLAQENNSSKYLCAYYEAIEAISIAELRRHLMQSVPEYMIPDFFVWMKTLPLTLNGKVDRRALPKPDFATSPNEYIAPRNEQEALICTEFCNILEVAQIGINDDFFNVGGNSLKAIRLVSRLQENFRIAVADIFNFRTPLEISSNVAYVRDHMHQKLQTIKAAYVRNAQESASIKVVPPLKKNFNATNLSSLVLEKKKIRTVMLTGATGYLGCHLFAQLLKQTDYDVCLLIRASSDELAFERINNKFSFYFEQDLSQYRNRIEVLASNIEANQLSLADATYRILINKIESVLHCAALVKHYGNYDEFYRANVKATCNLLDFSCLSKGKDFHYVSTYSVLLDGHIPGHETYAFDEDSDASLIVERNNLYARTKYEGEALCLSYRKRGVRSNIYRVGNQSMHSETYRNQENIDENGFFTRVKTMLNLGMIAREVALQEVSPVDLTALAIVKLFDKQNLSNSTYHVFNPNMCDLTSVLRSDLGLNLQEVSIVEFIDNMMEKIHLSTYRKHIELFMLHEGWLQNDDQSPTTKVDISQEKTLQTLAALGFTWPIIHFDMLTELIRQAFNERFEALRLNSIMQKLNSAELFVLAKLMYLNHYTAESLLNKQHIKNNNIKFIIDGFIDNYVESEGGWKSSIQLLSSGDVINLESIAKLAATTSSKAVFDSVSTLEIDVNSLTSIFSENNSFYLSTIHHLLGRQDVIQNMYAYSK